MIERTPVVYLTLKVAREVVDAGRRLVVDGFGGDLDVADEEIGLGLIDNIDPEAYPTTFLWANAICAWARFTVGILDHAIAIIESTAEDD